MSTPSPTVPVTPRRLRPRTLLAIAFGLFVLLGGVAVALFQLSKSRTFQFFGGLTARIETDRPVVALTFDDAPSATTTADVLRILAERNVKGTFYAIGTNIEAHPDAARAIVQGGHELGNHSYTHDRFLLKSRSFIAHEVETTNALIRAAGYEGEITFRPPYGKKLFGLPRFLRAHGIRTVTWDVESDTAHAGDADAIVKETLERARPGSIILMHPFCETSCAADREALPRIIDGLKEKGFAFVTVAELLHE